MSVGIYPFVIMLQSRGTRGWIHQLNIQLNILEARVIEYVCPPTYGLELCTSWPFLANKKP